MTLMYALSHSTDSTLLDADRNLIYTNFAMRSKPTSMLWELVGRLANTTLTIRISGEMGVGKEAVARLLCRHYPHTQVKFQMIDCRQLKITAAPSPMTRMNQLLASPQRHVIYLENIECASKEMQNRLFRLLNTSFPSSPPWILASSLQPLERFIHNGQFNIELFRALDTVHIMLPPLRSKSEKIPQILSWFLNHYNHNLPTRTLSLPGMDEMERLIDYHWPRNWRQLQEFAKNAFDKLAWDVPLKSSLPDNALPQEIDDIAAIYILSMAKMSIQKEKVLEEMMTASQLDEIGLLDLAIFNEAVNQISEYLEDKDDA